MYKCTISTPLNPTLLTSPDARVLPVQPLLGQAEGRETRRENDGAYTRLDTEGGEVRVRGVEREAGRDECAAADEV